VCMGGVGAVVTVSCKGEIQGVTIFLKWVVRVAAERCVDDDSLSKGVAVVEVKITSRGGGAFLVEYVGQEQDRVEPDVFLS
jgi:hypothetical protein